MALYLQFLLFVDTKTAQELDFFFVKVMDCLILPNDDWFIMSFNIYMYHHHKCDNNIDVKYLVIRTVSNGRKKNGICTWMEENNIDISNTYSNWLKFKLGFKMLVKQEALRERKPQPCLFWGARNSLVKRETVYLHTSRVHIPKISWISIYLYFHDVGNKHNSRK